MYSSAKKYCKKKKKFCNYFFMFTYFNFALDLSLTFKIKIRDNYNIFHNEKQDNSNHVFINIFIHFSIIPYLILIF